LLAELLRETHFNLARYLSLIITQTYPPSTSGTVASYTRTKVDISPGPKSLFADIFDTGIAATTTAHTPPLPYAPHLLASASNDRYIRLHSTHLPPVDAGKRQEQKGEVLCKSYVSVVPTCVVWDMTEGVWEAPVEEDDKAQGGGTEDDEESEVDGDEEDMWAGMEDVGDEELSEGEAGKRGKRRK
jgi:hypothetical protein